MRRAVDLGEPYDGRGDRTAMMPDMTASSLAGLVRADPAIAAIPMLLMTSEGLTDVPRSPTAPWVSPACLAKPLRQR